jgi:hypothetical protein
MFSTDYHGGRGPAAANGTQEQKMLAQQQELESLKAQLQLQLQNTAFQERLSRLESLVTTQMQTAAADKPAQATTAACSSSKLKSAWRNSPSSSAMRIFDAR